MKKLSVKTILSTKNKITHMQKYSTHSQILILKLLLTWRNTTTNQKQARCFRLIKGELITSSAIVYGVL